MILVASGLDFLGFVQVTLIVIGGLTWWQICMWMAEDYIEMSDD